MTSAFFIAAGAIILPPRRLPRCFFCGAVCRDAFSVVPFAAILFPPQLVFRRAVRRDFFRRNLFSAVPSAAFSFRHCRARQKIFYKFLQNPAFV